MRRNRKRKIFLFVLILTVSFGSIEILNPFLSCRRDKMRVRAAEIDSIEENSELISEEDSEEQETGGLDEEIESDLDEEVSTDLEEADSGEVDLEEVSSQEGDSGEVDSEEIDSQEEDEEADGSSLKPVYDEDTESTVYSCIYFGTYPQTQVTGDRLTNAITDAEYDENGDATIEGNKYHKVENVFGVSYFLYEPIKWKVLANPDGYIVAMAERGLDYCSYYEAMESVEDSTVDVQDLTDEELEDGTDRRVAYDVVSWEESTLRSWLNSYGKKKNIAGKNYKKEGKGFLNTAFSKTEQQDIKEMQEFEDSRFASYLSIAEGDKVSILNSAGVVNENYGFSSAKPASTGRLLEKTDYATERGRELNDKFSDVESWWISSSSEAGDAIQYVSRKGTVKSKGTESYHSLLARPVIVIDEESQAIKDAGKLSVSNKGGDSITVQLKADTYASLNDQKDGYKDATIEIFVKNIGSDSIDTVDAILEFDDGEQILDGENSIHFANIDAGAEKNIAWKFAIKPQKEGITAKYTIKLIGENLGETYLKNEIYIPKVETSKAQTDSSEEEASVEQESKTFLERLRDFFKGLS